MIIYPAIDLINGEVVRLHKGDFARKTTYGTDPVAVAKSYAEAGAEWLHLVDLDGAKDPANRQTDLISKIIAGSGLKVQTGGGIRSREDVAAWSRRVPAAWWSACRSRPGPGRRNDVGIRCRGHLSCRDVLRRDGAFLIAVSGWQEASSLSCPTS